MKVKVWTHFYNPFVMGGSCYQPTGFEKELDSEVDLGGGFKGFEITTPKGNTRIVEKTSGAIVGDSLGAVRNDIEASEIKVMAEQVKQACEECKKVKIISEEEFWKVYKF